MSYTPEVQADQNGQRSNKFSPFRYLKELCFQALYLALVGRQGPSPQAVPIPKVSEVPSDPSHRDLLP